MLLEKIKKMKEKKYSSDNIFVNLTKDELRTLYEGYKRAVYEIGWYEHDNPMLSYIMHFQKERGISGTRFCETLLLEAIAFKIIEEEP